jgi:uncharacterized protein (TIGR02118 family)
MAAAAKDIETMIKLLWCLARNPELSIAEASQHWFEVHGQLHAQPSHKVSGYVQHHTLIPAYDGDPKPTHDGVSIVWVPDVKAYETALATKAWQDASRDGQVGVRGGRPLLTYPIAFAMASEKVILDGETNPFMVKLIFVLRKNPALEDARFFAHWLKPHGDLGRKIPGLRRYVQNHGLKEAAQYSANVYDGWAEMWFDDLDALYAAAATEEWRALEADAHQGVDGAPLFDLPETCLVIARERRLV